MLGVEKKRKKESSLHSLLSDNFSFDFKYPPVTVIEKNWQKLFYKWVKINLKLKKVNNRDWKHHFWGNWLDLVLWFLGKNTLSKCRNLSSVIIRLLCSMEIGESMRTTYWEANQPYIWVWYQYGVSTEYLLVYLGTVKGEYCHCFLIIGWSGWIWPFGPCRLGPMCGTGSLEGVNTRSVGWWRTLGMVSGG